jgi:class 3 adenylate cyclase
MQRFIRQRKIIRTESGQPAFDMRVGIHTGSVVAGILGTQKFQYDIWGETVNIANRIEKAGMEGKVIISNAALQALGDTHPFIIEPVHSLQVGEKKIELFSVLLEVNPD